MDAEEKLRDAFEEEDGEEFDEHPGLIQLREDRFKSKQKNKAIAGRFIGKGRKTREVILVPRYYGELVTWAFHQYIEREGWSIIETLGYQEPEPWYLDVSTNSENKVDCLGNGRALLEKNENRMVATLDINLRSRNSVQVEAPYRMKEEAKSFIAGIDNIVKTENFYRGKCFEYGTRHRFLQPGQKNWDSIILSEDIKEEVRANTVNFLKKREQWGKYGIPSKRGIILAGQPGTGKTIMCKALMAEAEGITCITTNAYGIDEDEYITELYDMARDLSPAILFIEDIDLIGQNRNEFGYQKGSALLSLLNVMDGIEDNTEIITVATTNCLDTLDKALGERPSRFDRVIRVERPTLDQRREYIELLGKKVRMDENTKDYIARRSEYCTPAQLQEVIHGLVIEKSDAMTGEEPYLEVSKDDIDRAISRINGRSKQQIGFTIACSHNGNGNQRIVWNENAKEL
ncbi:MAG: ATP-binding protein [Dehalococcoidales bacterium]|nr:ATP-binding protein [Dehalococcoidales bacterium]